MTSVSLRTAAAYSYFEENLQYLSELCEVATTQKRNSLLRATGKDSLGETTRFETLTWVLEVAHGKVGTKTAQLACTYFDMFCQKWRGVSSPEVARVVAGTCLLVSSKFNETIPLSADWVSQTCGGICAAEAVIKLELMLLINLNWDLEQATASEIARVMLTMCAPAHDFEELLRESDCFANVCYPAAKLIAHSPIAIALASICCVFDQRRLTAYRDAWLREVLPKTTVTKSEILALCSQIRSHLLEAYASDADTECDSPMLDRAASLE